MTSATLLATNCQPVYVSGSNMIFNRQNAKGIWDVYSGNPTNSSLPLLTAAATGHRGASSATPDGQNVIIETAEGIDKTWPDAAPGKGSGNDLYLFANATGIVSRLTTGRKGTIWGCVKPDGSKVCWSEMTTTPTKSKTLLGFWQIHVADITNGQLVNEKVYGKPDSFYETYGWYDDTHIMFCSNAGLGNWLTSQCWTIDEELATSPVRVSQPVGKPPSNADHEFMFTPPDTMFDGTWILTSIGYETVGLDLWRIQPDGSNMTRVSWFNTKKSGWPAPKYSVVGGLAFDLANPDVIYAGVSHGGTGIDCWMIEL